MSRPPTGQHARAWALVCAIGSFWMLLAGCTGEVGFGEPEAEPLFLVPGVVEAEGAQSVEGEEERWEAPIQVIAGRIVSGGDMVLGGGPTTAAEDTDVRFASTAGIKSALYRWPEGIVRYHFHGSMGSTARTMVRAVMDELQSKTGRGVLFRVKQADTADWVEIKRDEAGCWAHLGRTGGKQVVNLGKGCRTKGVIRHELAHTLGLIHEHQRMMRDDHVKVLWANIPADRHAQFKKWNVTYGDTPLASTGLSPYDLKSIMHYSSWTFAYPGKRSLRKRNGDSIPDQTAYSVRDIAGLKKYYPPR